MNNVSFIVSMLLSHVIEHAKTAEAKRPVKKLIAELNKDTARDLFLAHGFKEVEDSKTLFELPIGA